MTGADTHTLTGAYALDAVAETERTDIELHLAACPTCALEASEFLATAARLGAALAVLPPRLLRDQVLTEIRSTRQGPARVVRFAVRLGQLRLRWTRHFDSRR